MVIDNRVCTVQRQRIVSQVIVVKALLTLSKLNCSGFLCTIENNVKV